MKTTESEDAAALRKAGVDYLVARGWNKSHIAKEAAMSSDNLRLLCKPGKGKYSEAGIRLDRFLEKHGAFSLGTKSGTGGVKPQHLVFRESPLNYIIQRDIGLPSAEQIESAIVEARQGGDDDSIASLRELQDRVYGILEESDALKQEFAELIQNVRAASVERKEVG